MKLKIKCPAKINLSLKVFKKDEITGFHLIESIMQSINLFDYLTVEKAKCGLNFSGNSSDIVYDETNLVIKACKAFFNKTKIRYGGLNIYLEKNIPVAAGLAGGSTDAAGMILALNTLFGAPLSQSEIFEINAALGSDINFCYQGGHALARGKGDNLTRLPFEEFILTLVVPKNLKISTKDAYLAFDALQTPSNLPNDLEYAIIPKYPQLKQLAENGFQMSGSGPSFFIKHAFFPDILNSSKYNIYKNLKSIPYGVCIYSGV